MIRFPFNNEGIITRSAKGKGDLSPRIRFTIDSGLGGFGEDAVSAGAIKRGVR